jgi:hypothetical protein
MSVASLIERIERVFPEWPFPEMTLLQAQQCDRTLDREISEAEWEATGRLDRGLTWKEVDSATLLKCDAALSHIAEEGFVYYIPAYLRLALRQLADSTDPPWEAYGSTISHLSGTDNYALGRYKRLTDAQIDTVVAFLQEARNAGGFEGKKAAEALAKYWETPEAMRHTLIHIP